MKPKEISRCTFQVTSRHVEKISEIYLLVTMVHLPVRFPFLDKSCIPVYKGSRDFDLLSIFYAILSLSIFYAILSLSVNVNQCLGKEFIIGLSNQRNFLRLPAVCEQNEIPSNVYTLPFC